MTTSSSNSAAALLGVSHPHTSGRTRVLMERSIPILGAWDDDPAIGPFTEKFEIPNRSLNDLLADPDINLVLVHSKSHSMVPLAAAALRAGKAVLVEKPGGKNLADLETLVQVVRETGGVCQIGYCYRFSQAVRITAEMLQHGLLGQIHQVRLHGGCSLDEAATTHLNQPDDMGGAFFVIGCHLVDLLIYHLGMPATVNARIPKFSDASSFREDAAAAVFGYHDKIVSFDFSSWDPLPWVESWQISFYGTEGILHARPLPATCDLFLKAPNDRFPAGWTSWSESSFPIAWAAQKTAYSPELAEIGNLDYFRREIESFVTASVNRARVEIPATQARDILKLIAACYESSVDQGREVKLA